jgi:hypothetical protein
MDDIVKACKHNVNTVNDLCGEIRYVFEPTLYSPDDDDDVQEGSRRDDDSPEPPYEWSRGGGGSPTWQCWVKGVLITCMVVLVGVWVVVVVVAVVVEVEVVCRWVIDACECALELAAVKSSWVGEWG